MDQDKFIDLLDLAYSDYKGADDTGTMIGIIVIALHKTGLDLGMQMGANVDPCLVDMALKELSGQGRLMDRIPGKVRRTV